MNRIGKNGTVILFLILSLFMYPFANVATAGTIGEPLVLKAGALKGTIIYPSGRPVPNTTVKVLDKDGAMLARGVSDKTGRFSLKSLDAGTYTLNVGGKYDLQLVLEPEAEASEMKVVLPEKAAAAAAGKAGDLTMTHAVIGGVLVAVIVGAAVAASDDGSSHGTPPSP
ncbi:MAG: hypothetical protein Kow0099_29800 [Candidatus Abyssubacteria bacterium]